MGDHRIGLDFDLRLDPGRSGIDDRHTGFEMREVDPVAKGRPGGSELGTRVHSFRLGRVGGDVRHDPDSPRPTRSRTASVR